MQHFILLTKKGSEMSLNHSKKNMNTLMKKKKKQRVKKNIKKLFDQIRNNSSSNNLASNHSSSNNTVVEIEDSVLSNTVIQNDANIQRDNDTSSLIVINDEDLPSTSQVPTMFCSTPIANRSNQYFKEDVVNLTKEINRDSYFTVDLTTETDVSETNTSGPLNTVIDLVNADDTQDCTPVSHSNTSVALDYIPLSSTGRIDMVNADYTQDCTPVSLSNTSAVALDYKPLSRIGRKKKENYRIPNNVAQLNLRDKTKLLEMIAQKIFSGCNMPPNVKSSLSNIAESLVKPDSAQDSYIKEVIVGKTPSRNSVGSNIYNPERDMKNKTGLRMIVIDGSNVAMQHGNGRIFSVKGLKICIDYFLRRGHVVKAFVPRFRCKSGKSTQPRLLDDLERKGLVVYTPSREIQGRNITPYDDRYIVQCAAEFDGIIVSGDNYRDLANENPKWRYVIENRLLPFTWVNDMIMFPRDPLGRHGPNLEQFLRHPNSRNVNL